jgi:hypothetical protein
LGAVFVRAVFAHAFLKLEVEHFARLGRICWWNTDRFFPLRWTAWQRVRFLVIRFGGSRIERPQFCHRGCFGRRRGRCVGCPGLREIGSDFDSDDDSVIARGWPVLRGEAIPSRSDGATCRRSAMATIGQERDRPLLDRLPVNGDEAGDGLTQRRRITRGDADNARHQKNHDKQRRRLPAKLTTRVHKDHFGYYFPCAHRLAGWSPCWMVARLAMARLSFYRSSIVA